MAIPPSTPAPARPDRVRRFGPGAILILLSLVLAAAHGVAIFVALGGRAGIENGWPIWRDDHPLYFHSALVTRDFLRSTGTTAGYDPYFMAGYAKSVVFPASSTLPELVLFAFGGAQPATAYKLYVLAAAALAPWLIVLAARWLGASPGAVLIATLLYLIYVWTDFPINYVGFGMLPYFLAIPIGLAATAAVVRYLERGGFVRWELAALLCVLSVMVHLTAAMVVVPSALLAYLVASFGAGRSDRLSGSRHLGVWLIPVLVLGLNAFWWLPGLWLAATKGPSDFVFAHPEGILRRIWQILTSESPIQAAILGAGLVGLAGLAGRWRVRAAGLAGFVGAGFLWGYLAGGFRALDFLQPGRHTYAFYSGLAVAGGIGIGLIGERLRSQADRSYLWGALALVLIGFRVFAPSVEGALRSRLAGPEPFLSSRPSSRLTWVVQQVREHLRPGERLLYEEGGFGRPDVPDPFAGGRFSGLLPFLTDFKVELLGGPYLHASLATNFTQFGEGKLFGLEGWGREQFDRYARLYRPSAILCWSPEARAFCRANPDRIELLAEDGPLLFARVKGFEGHAITGLADVEAYPGRLVVRPRSAGVDGTIVLRYHSVPCLRSSPPANLDSVRMEGDPVPFIRLRPEAGELTLELTFPP